MLVLFGVAKGPLTTSESLPVDLGSPAAWAVHLCRCFASVYQSVCEYKFSQVQGLNCQEPNIFMFEKDETENFSLI